MWVIYLITCLCVASAADLEWDYSTGANGVSNWGSLEAKCAGESQSPINLYEGDVVKDDSYPAFQFTRYDTSTPDATLQLNNNGHAVGVRYDYTDSAPKLTVSGGGLPDTYNVAQFHFHWGSDGTQGSEHQINSFSYPMELHIVHYNNKYADLTTAVPKADGLAVLGFMFEVSESDNAAYADIVSGMTNIKDKGAEHTLAKFALDTLLPADKTNFFRYSGSLTTPTCDESVTWTVFKETIKISAAQLAAFRTVEDKSKSVIVNNYRPPQPIGTRVVNKNFDNDWKWGYETGVMPAKWQHNYEACGGSSQSPVDIPKATTISDKYDVFSFSGYDSTAGRTMKMINNGHTVNLEFGGSPISVSGGGFPETYNAAQLHFHWGSTDMKGSEHTVDGTTYPMELHIVHYANSHGSLGAAVKQPEGLAVLGFFFEVSNNDNPNYASLIEALGSITDPEQTVDLTPVRLDSLIPSSLEHHFYRYSGSLTTPGCFESVIWTVFKQTIPISAAQLAKFRKLKSVEKNEEGDKLYIVDNFRPVQALHTRVVKTVVPKWTYAGPVGPADWSVYYPTCVDHETAAQSPINIDPETVYLDTTLRGLTFTGYESTEGVVMEMSNNGHTAVISIKEGDMNIRGGGLGGTFKVAQMHFHWGANDQRGSEHTVDGVMYPLELHIVHYNTKYADIGAAVTQPDGLAVLGFMFEISDTMNPDLDPIISNLELIKEPKSAINITEFALRTILPYDRRDFYRYQGGLTTPGCFESVRWTVFKEAIPISRAQMAKFRTLKSIEKDNNGAYIVLQDNYRPVQGRNGRKISSTFLIGTGSHGVTVNYSIVTLTLALLCAFVQRHL